MRLTRRAVLGAAVVAPVRAQSGAALPESRRAEARPILAAEREARVERARELMTAAKMDAICLTGGTSLRYFTGVRWGISERLFACVIPRRGEPFCACPAFEEDRAREQAGEKTLQAYRAAWRQVREGMTNRDLAGLIGVAFVQLGFPGEVGVQVGEFTALPHGSARPQQIREGSLVMMDDGCTVEGYTADVTRTVVFGKPTDKMRRVWDIVRRAQTAALAAARPGAPCEAVDRAARKVIEDAGYGPGYRYFTHRVGHGIGLDGHEWPYLVGGNKQPLAPGMTFSDEPGIYIPGEFGMRHEDCMYITENGAQLFTPPSLPLEQGI